MRAHKLKVWPKYFHELKLENKTCELRRGDRDFRAGDYLMLMEWDNDVDKLTGAYLYRRILHVMTAADHPRGLVDGFVLLSIDDITSSERAELQGQNTLMRGPVEWIAPNEKPAAV